MLEQILGYAITAIASLAGAVAFMYAIQRKSEEKHALEIDKKNAEHTALIHEMLAESKAERAACQKENEMMKEELARLRIQLQQLTETYGELKGRLSAYEEMNIHRPHNQRKEDKAHAG